MAAAFSFQCIFCDKDFSAKSSLKRHYETKHDSVPDSFYMLKPKKEDKQLCPHCLVPQSKFLRHLETCSAKVVDTSQDLRQTISETSRRQKMASLDSDPDVIQPSPEKISITYDKDLSNMLVDYMALKENYAKPTIDNYLQCLKKFVMHVNSSEHLSINSVQEAFSSDKHFEEYITLLETVSERKLLFSAQKKLSDFFYFKLGINIESYGKLPDLKIIIWKYLSSPKRTSMMENFSYMCRGEQYNATPSEVRAYVMGEVLLLTKTKDFLLHCVLGDFQAQFNQDGFDYNSRTLKAHFPSKMAILLQRYVSQIRPTIMKKKNTQKNAKLFGDQIGSNIVPLKHITKYIEDFGGSPFNIDIEKIISSGIDSRPPPITAGSSHFEKTSRIHQAQERSFTSIEASSVTPARSLENESEDLPFESIDTEETLSAQSPPMNAQKKKTKGTDKFTFSNNDVKFLLRLFKDTSKHDITPNFVITKISWDLDDDWELENFVKRIQESTNASIDEVAKTIYHVLKEHKI